MPKNRIILVIGFLIALLPILGFPHSWESAFQVLSGLGIVFLSVLIAVDKRLMRKAKAEKRMKKLKEKAVSQNSPTDTSFASQPASGEDEFFRNEKPLS